MALLLFLAKRALLAGYQVSAIIDARSEADLLLVQDFKSFCLRALHKPLCPQTTPASRKLIPGTIGIGRRETFASAAGAARRKRKIAHFGAELGILQRFPNFKQWLVINAAQAIMRHIFSPPVNVHRVAVH